MGVFKRHKSREKSSSDTEVVQSKFKDFKWPKVFDTLTVDGLARYRRRRKKVDDTDDEDNPKDFDISYCPTPELNDLENLITEYRRSFGGGANTSEQVKETTAKQPNTINETSNERIFGLTDANQEKTDINSKTDTSIPIYKSLPIRRNTCLKLDGEFCGDTETASKFPFYKGIYRVKLARIPTTLKMEGDMKTVTEKCEKFIKWLNVRRPELIRNPTQLKLEGVLQTSTENHDQYVPFVGVKRPELLRQSAQLKLEGESHFLPEYTDVFRPHTFHDPRGMVPNYNQTGANEAKDKEKTEEELEEERKKELEMKMLISNLQDLKKSTPLEVPEYKDAFKDFPRERPKLIKPEDEIGFADGSKIQLSSTPTKFTTKIDQDPEYKSMYLNRDHSLYHQDYPDYNIGRSEGKLPYTPHGYLSRRESLKKPSNLSSIGSINVQPEYRDPYCAKRDYVDVDSASKSNRNFTSSRRRENNWINNINYSNEENLQTQINPEYDRNAFQVLNPGIYDDKIVTKKPPPGDYPHLYTRRNSKTAQMDPLGGEVATMKNRSPSPTFRFNVCNVDDKPRGFGRRRRSLSLQNNPPPAATEFNNIVSSDDDQRLYSPSFGKNPRASDNNNGGNQAFVILDENSSSRTKEGVNRFVDKNSNVNKLNRDRLTNKTSPNWMPPWYDNY